MKHFALFLVLALSLTGCQIFTRTQTNTQVNTGTTPPPENEGTTIQFSSVRRFDIGGLDNQINSQACVVSNSAADLERLISRGGPQSLREAQIDFSTKTLVSVYSKRGTSIEVTQVTEASGQVVVRYRVITDPQKLLLTVVYGPNEHILIPKTTKTVVCTEA